MQIKAQFQIALVQLRRPEIEDIAGKRNNIWRAWEPCAMMKIESNEDSKKLTWNMMM